MTTSVNVGRLANIFRGRWMTMHDLSEIYKPAITRNKEKLMDAIRGWRSLRKAYVQQWTAIGKERAEAATKSELARKVRVLKGFYTVEMAPPGISEAGKLRSDINLIREFLENKCYLYMTVRQAWLIFLVGLEIILWFFIGETIGKGHIVGYLV